MQNPKALEATLDAIWLGTYKLRVNIHVIDCGTEKEANKNLMEFNDQDGTNKGHLRRLSFTKAVVGGGITTI